MFIRHSLKNMLRSWPKSALFFLLLTALGAVLCIGVSLTAAILGFLKECDDNYTTIAVFEYIGVDYPDETIFDHDIGLCMEEFDFSALAKSPYVLNWDENAVAFGSIAGKTAEAAEPHYKDAVVAVIYILSYNDRYDAYQYSIIEDLLHPDAKATSGYINLGDIELESGHLYLIHGGGHVLPFRNEAAARAGVDGSVEYMFTDISAPGGNYEIPADSVLYQIAATYRTMNTGVTVYATNDLEALLPFQQAELSVIKGRSFSPEEYAAGAKVCLLPERLAVLLDLEPGGRLDLSLAVLSGATLRESYWAGTGFQYEDTYTVAGIFSPNDDYRDTVFIPKSGAADLSANRFSYTLGQARLKNSGAERFAVEMQNTLPLRVRMTIYDQGYAAAAAPLRDVLRIALIVTAVCALTTLAVLALFGFLFVYRQRDLAKLMRRAGVGQEGVFTYFLFGSGCIALLGAAFSVFISDKISGYVMSVVRQIVENYGTGDLRYSNAGIGLSRAIDFAPDVDAIVFVLTALVFFIFAVLACFIFTSVSIRSTIVRDRPAAVRNSSRSTGASQQGSQQGIRQGSRQGMRQDSRQVTRDGSISGGSISDGSISDGSISGGSISGSSISGSSTPGVTYSKYRSLFDDLTPGGAGSMSGSYTGGSTPRGVDPGARSLHSGSKSRSLRGGSLKYAWLSVWRGASRSALPVVLCAFSAALFLQLTGTTVAYETSYDDLLQDTEFNGYFSDFNGTWRHSLMLPGTVVNDFHNSSILSGLSVTKASHYLYGIDPPQPDASPFVWETFSNALAAGPGYIWTNDLAASQEFYGCTELPVTFMDGYDLSVFSLIPPGEEPFTFWGKLSNLKRTEDSEPVPVIVSTAFLNENNLSFGDMIGITISGGSGLGGKMLKIIGAYIKQGRADNIYAPLNDYHYTEYITMRNSREPDNPRISLTDVPASYAFHPDPDAGSLLPLTFGSASFRLRGADDLAALKSFLNDRGYSEIKKARSIRSFVTIEDNIFLATERAMSQRLWYMQKIFPALYVLLELLAALIPFIIVRLRKRESALMRAQGAAKHTAFFSIFWEQALLCIPGVLIGAGIWRAVTGTPTRTGYILTVLFALLWLLGAGFSALTFNRGSVRSILKAEE